LVKSPTFPTKTRSQLCGNQVGTCITNTIITNLTRPNQHPSCSYKNGNSTTFTTITHFAGLFPNVTGIFVTDTYITGIFTNFTGVFYSITTPFTIC
jgi:hypothetical protein